jgi:hypothetical protein
MRSRTVPCLPNSDDACSFARENTDPFRPLSTAGLAIAAAAVTDGGCAAGVAVTEGGCAAGVAGSAGRCAAMPGACW